MTFNKTNLIEVMAEQAEISKAEAGRQLDNVVNGVEKLLEGMEVGDKIQLIGFLTLEVVEKKEREATNPKTGEKIIVPAKIAVKAKAGKKLQEIVAE